MRRARSPRRFTGTALARNGGVPRIVAAGGARCRPASAAPGNSAPAPERGYESALARIEPGVRLILADRCLRSVCSLPLQTTKRVRPRPRWSRIPREVEEATASCRGTSLDVLTARPLLSRLHDTGITLSAQSHANGIYAGLHARAYRPGGVRGRARHDPDRLESDAMTAADGEKLYNASGGS